MKEPAFHIKALSERQTNGQLRKLEGDAKASFDFFSNDYLGFVTNGSLSSSNEGNRSGATGSRLLSGDSDFALELEQFIADFHKIESALLFQSGYMANLGLISCIAKRGDTIIYDRLVHASLRQAVQLSPASVFAFGHNDMTDLEAKLERAKGTVFVVTEALFSMDGDFGALEEICELTNKFGGYVIVDEAHSTGVFGEQGRGLVDELGLQDQVWARIHTFGKAAGVHGAAVLGSRHLKQFLVNFSKPFIYTTASSDHSLHMIKESLNLFKDDLAREELWGLVRYFESKIKEVDLELHFYPSSSPIKCLRIQKEGEALKIAEALQKANFMVKAIRYPTVPKGTERIRICLHRHNTQDQIDSLIHLIRTLV